MKARRGLRLAFTASFVLGGGVGAGACNEKKATETAATADANAKADAGVPPSLDADGATEAGAAATDASSDDAGDARDARDSGEAAAHAGEGGARPRVDASTASLETAETGAHGDGGSRGSTLELDESAAGKTIDLALGQSMTLSLGANATTGFDWSVTKAPAALGTPSMSYVQGGAQPGAPGTRKLTWTLKSRLPPGEHALELGYARSFEKGVAPFKVFKLKVRAAR